MTDEIRVEEFTSEESMALILAPSCEDCIPFEDIDSEDWLYIK